ncbi:MAG: hypothetical protein KatS3mg109_1245 [Pirellulaceae bacterium]|nr:MAG: hypothetical protein KatS3mg109_1245 [Pirellulaceae bacterium]
MPRRIRKLDVQPQRVDTTHWPVDLLLMVLGGFAVGTALAFQRFDDPVWYQSAWVSVISIPWLVACGMVASRLLSKRWMRRSMQVGLLASLVLHLLLILAAVNVVLPARLVRPSQTATVTERPREVPPMERVTVAVSSPQRSQLPPIDSPMAAAADVDVAATDRTSRAVQQNLPVAEADSSTDSPNLMRRKQDVPSEARRAPSLSELSRNETRRPQTASASLSISGPQQPEPKIVATKVELTPERHRPEPGQVEVAATPQPAELTPSLSGDSPASVPPAAMQPARRQATREPVVALAQHEKPASGTTATPVLVAADVPASPKRTSAASAGLPQAELPLAASQPSPAELPNYQSDAESQVAQLPEPLPERRATVVPRTLADPAPSAISSAPTGNAAPSPAEMAQGPAAPRAASEQAARIDTEPQPSAERPAVVQLSRSLAQTESAPPEQPSPDRTAMRRSAHAPSTADAAEAGQATSPALVASRAPVDPTAALRPTDTPLARQPIRAESVASRQPAEVREASREAALAQSTFQRQLTAEQASIQPFDRPAITVAQASRTARPQTLLAADQPAPHVGQPPAQPTPAPLPLAVDRAQTGVAGGSSGPNLSRQLPAGDSPALSSSGASLPEASQSVDPGAALTPAAPALSITARAHRPVPGSLSASVVTPSGAQSPQPASDVSLAASPANMQLEAEVERGRVTGEQGRLPIDVGPERVVAELQTDRGSGGGRPELSAIPVAPSPTGSHSGTARPSIPTDTLAAQLAAPSASGGSRPAAIDAAPTAVNQARTDLGGTRRTSGTPSAAILEGPPAEPNAAEALGELALRTAPTTGEVHHSIAATDSIAGRATTARSHTRPVPVVTDAMIDSGSLGTGAQVERSAADVISPGDVAVHMPGSLATAAGPRGHESPQTAGAERPASGEWLAPEPSAVVRVRAHAADALAGPAVAGDGLPGSTRPARSPLTAQEGTRGSPSAPQIALGSPSAEPLPAAQVVQGSSSAQRTGSPILLPMPDETKPGPQGAATLALSGTRAIAVSGVNASDSPSLPVARLEQPKAGRVGPPATFPTGDDGAPTIAPGATAGTQSHEVVAAVALAGRPGIEQQPAGLPITAPSSPGEGGLSDDPIVDLGVEDRRATRDSDNVQLQLVRIPRRVPSGTPPTLFAVDLPAEAFRKRTERNRPGAAGQLGPQTERAIEMGLAFLARYQQSDGRWTLDGFDEPSPVMNSDVAATGLALLAFQGAGYTHREYQYRDVVQKAIEYLLSAQQPDGVLFEKADPESNRVARLYSHAIATLALSEAYGMTRDPALMAPTQKALDYIVAAQSPELGGWRYTPQINSDTSVSGWMLMALKSGELAGLTVPRTTYDRVVRWLDRAQAPDEPHLYRYNPDAPDTPAQRHGRVPSPTMTSVGLLMRLYTGWRRDHPAMQAGGDYLRENLPGMSDLSDPVASRRRDTYYWYYATQVMFHLGGQYWQEWNDRLRPLLLSTQVQQGPYAGSWDPFRPVPDRWAAHAGRLYVTTMNLLSLEVTYRYLPLYESTAK